MEFYSHLDKKLIIHLKEVKKMALDSLPNELNKLGTIGSLTHDFGKYTTYFQDYLFSKIQEKNSLNNHGFISAVFGAYCGFNEFDNKSIYPYLLYSVILHHHGSLRNVGKDLPRKQGKINREEDEISLIEKIDTAYKQLSDMEKNIDILEKDYEGTIIEKYVREFIINKPVEDVIIKLKKKEFYIDKINKNSEQYFIHQMLYSAIINSDKISASNTYIPDKKYIPFVELNEFKEEKIKNSPKTDLNRIRGEIFENIQKEIEENKDDKLFSITSPTGTGKTYAGFFAALKLRDLMKKESKIIYALPFTSIIDQNYISIKELMKNKEDYLENSSSYLIKHHNLANVDYEYSAHDYTKAQAEILIESWNSGIIVTTFVQLLQTLIGSRNRMLKKFNSIRNSIIILDEIQALDIKFYILVDFILKEASQKLNCTIIMMTATKPLILKESKELLKNNEKYFKQFNRTIIHPKLNKISVEDFIDEFEDNIEDKSYLIICNTINQSLEIFNEISQGRDNVYYLSTNILPIDRRKIIDKIREKLKKQEKLILVSTQVVEAGVDFDFDVVIRDLAPLDSIIQAAGRCNRNGNKDIGEVYIYNMVKENNIAYGDLIYGKTLLAITKEILSERDFIEEKDFFEIISAYFKEVNENTNQEASNEFIKSIQKLRFSYEPKEKYSLNKFSLIRSNPDYYDVFFIKDDEAEIVFNKLKAMVMEKDLNKKKEIYLQIKSDIRDYTLSLPKKYRSKINNDGVIPYVSKELFNEIYDNKTGFIRNDKEEYLIF